MQPLKIIVLSLWLILSFELFRRDNGNDLVLNTTGENAPKMAWQFKTKGPTISSPIIIDDVVYVGSMDSILYAINLNSGKELWKVKTGGKIASTVAYGGDKIYLLSGDGLVYAIEKSTGKIVWKFKTLGGLLGERKYDFADYYHSSSLLEDGILYFGSGDGRIYSIDSNEGKFIWSFKTHGINHSSPVIDDNKLFIGSFDGHLYCLNKNTGTLVWKFKTIGHRYFPDGEIQSAPVVADGKVFFGSRDYNLYALDINEGYSHWNRQFPLGWAMALTATDSILYVGTSDDKLFIAMDIKTGEELWRFDAGFNIFGSCVLSPSSAYFGTLMGKMYAVNLISQEIEWVTSTTGYEKNKNKYFKADDSYRNDIAAILKTSDDYIQALYNLGAIFSTPALGNNRLVISSTDGTLYCFDL